MVDRHQLPSWREIFLRISEPEPHRGRARCPIHNGDSRTSLSVNEDRGLYHCHVCHSGGDRIHFIIAVMQTDFAGAMKWFGLEPGKPPKPDVASLRRNAAMDRVRDWVSITGRRLRDEYLARQRISACARNRLALDPEDKTAWELLRIAYDGECRNEYLLDKIDLCRDDEERLQAWRKYRDEI
jgi:hypothetical protein